MRYIFQFNEIVLTPSFIIGIKKVNYKFDRLTIVFQAKKLLDPFIYCFYHYILTSIRFFIFMYFDF